MKGALITIFLFSKFFTYNLSASERQPEKIHLELSVPDVNAIVDGLYMLPYGKAENAINSIREQVYNQTKK